MKKLIFSFLSLCIFFQLSAQNPKYIFFFIGDGMGMVQAQLTDAYLLDQYQDSLTFLRFRENGLQTTHSASSRITDSAAAGTALATGYKTKNGSICIAPNGVDSLTSYSFKAKQKGFKVGIVTSVSIDHATPAAFYARAGGRSSYNNIAMQLPETAFEYFAGGTFKDPAGDSGDVFESLKDHGYFVVTSPDSLKYVPEMGAKVCVLDPAEQLYYGIDREKNRFTLADLTRTGIEALHNPDGFFMMVEGGKIDWASHGHDAATTIYETIEFEKAVREAISFYRKHPAETLIIVTADHETGGMGIGSTLYPYLTNVGILKNQPMSNESFQKVLQAEFSGKEISFEHTMQLLSKYYRVGSKDGIEFNAYDSLRMQRTIEYINFPEKFPDRRETQLVFNSGKTGPKNTRQDRLPSIIHTMNVILSEKAGIGWTTHAHSGVAVPVFATGSGSEAFNGFYDNTDLAWKISKLFD